MLILTRKINEKIIIGDHIAITVLRVDGPKIQLGISAPKNITVHRQEIYERIKRNKNKSMNDAFMSNRVIL